MKIKIFCRQSFFIFILLASLGCKTWAGNSVNISKGQSISLSAQQLKPGDTLVIEEGIYEETSYIKVSGTAEAPITIEGRGNVIIDGSQLDPYTPAFDLKNNNFIHFKNLHVKNMRAGVRMKDSHHITIDGLTVENSHFAVLMTDSSDILIENTIARNNRNGFRGEGKTHDVTFDNIEAYASQDKYKGYEHKYLNGDGFIFEKDTFNLTFKNIISSFHWDSGLDIKGSDVTINHVICEGNANGLKLWGQNISVSQALIYKSKSQPNTKKGKRPVEGIGINVRKGVVQVSHSSFINNESEDVKVAEKGVLTLEKSLVFRNKSKGKLLGDYGKFSSKDVLWFDGSLHKPPSIPSSADNLWADPQFIDPLQNKFDPGSPVYRFNPPLGATIQPIPAQPG